MNRRSFLQSILAAGVAPAFIGSSVLMPVRQLWQPFNATVWPTGIDDAPLLQSLIDTASANGGGTITLGPGEFRIAQTLVVKKDVILQSGLIAVIADLRSAIYAQRDYGGIHHITVNVNNRTEFGMSIESDLESNWPGRS
jgi:hypothetical protein